MRPCGFRPYHWARRVRPEPFRIPEAPAFRRPPGECPPFGAQRLRPLAPTWNDQSLRRARTAAHIGEMAPALAPAGRAASLAFGAFHRRPMPEGRRARPPCAGADHTTGRRRERPAGFFGRPPNAKSGAGPVPATPVPADLGHGVRPVPPRSSGRTAAGTRSRFRTHARSAMHGTGARSGGGPPPGHGRAPNLRSFHGPRGMVGRDGQANGCQVKKTCCGRPSACVAISYVLSCRGYDPYCAVYRSSHQVGSLCCPASQLRRLSRISPLH